MKCFTKGELPVNNNFLKGLKKFKKKRIYSSNDLVFVTKDTIDKFSGIDVNLALLSNVPSFEEFSEYYLKYPGKVKAYGNILMNEVHFPSVIDTIDSGMLWVIPNVKKIIDERLAKIVEIKK